jgi:hypothetical protein
MLPSSGFRHALALALVALPFALPACGGDGGLIPVDPVPPGHVEPPAPGPEKAPTSSETRTFAFRVLNLGDANRDGSLNQGRAWKQYGYDLDGKISTAISTDLCKPRAGAQTKSVYPDGNGGIDNSFGAHLLGVILTFWANAPTRVDESLAAGKASVLIAVTGLGPDASYNPLGARAYEAAPLGKPALFDGSDVWPVRPESLSKPGDLAASTAFTESAYLVDDTWVAQMQGTLVLTLPLPDPGGELLLRLPIHDPLITMSLDAGRQHGTTGTLAGVIPVDALRAEVARIYHAIDPACAEKTVSSIAAQVEQAADMRLDGSADPAQECDAVSIGVGFEAAAVQLGGVGEPVALGPSCF